MAITFADLPNPAPLTDEQKKLVKATVPVLEKHGPEITHRFYSKMIEEHPELKNLFNHSKQQVSHMKHILQLAS